MSQVRNNTQAKTVGVRTLTNEKRPKVAPKSITIKTKVKEKFGHQTPKVRSETLKE